MALKVLRVALDVPLPKLFDYAAESSSGADVGRRIAVPFGARSMVGVIVEVGVKSEIAPEKLRAAGPILSDMPPLAPEWLELARFAAQYYQRPLGEVIHAALPPRLRRSQPLRSQPEAYSITDAGRAALTRLPVRARIKRAVLEQLAARPQSPDALRSGPMLRALLREGLAAPTSAPRTPIRFTPEHTLTIAQATAVTEIVAALGRYHPLLLVGVTGSGKTEVYLHCVARALARGGQALVLVPEINLTPQLEEAFSRRFPGARVITLTSALAANERAERWLAAQSGAADIVLGTRLAVFAPLPQLGLVVVDEEH